MICLSTRPIIRRNQRHVSRLSSLIEGIYRCIDPLDPAGHSPTLFNIVSEKQVAESANFQNALQIGKDCMQAYENKLPQSFYNKISSPMVTMDTTRKRINLGATTTVDTEVIFNRTLDIIGSGEFDLHDVFSHEVAPIPTSLFLDDGSMRQASSKSKHKNYLQVEESSRTVEIPDFIVLDGCAILWTNDCAIPSTVQYLARGICTCDTDGHILRLQHKSVYSWSKSIRYG